jgi:hypothetical protein
MTRRRENAKQRRKSTEISNAGSTTAIRHTGWVNRSENSLNQHIKLKHPEEWEKMKAVNAALGVEVIKEESQKLEEETGSS